MQSKRKSNSIVTHTLLPGNVLQFDVVGAGSFTFDPAGCTDETETRAALHGYIQKIVDRAAIGRDPETGMTASPQEKFDAMKECADRLAGGGEWNAVAAGGQSGGLLYRAVRAIYPSLAPDRKTFAAYITQRAADETAKRTDGKKVSEHDVRIGLAKVAKIAAEIERIKAMEPDAKVEVDFTDLE